MLDEKGKKIVRIFNDNYINILTKIENNRKLKTIKQQ